MPTIPGQEEGPDYEELGKSIARTLESGVPVGRDRFFAAMTVAILWSWAVAEAAEVQMITLGELKNKLRPVLWNSLRRNNISSWSQDENTKIKTISLNNGREIVYRFWLTPATITFSWVTYGVSYDDNIDLDLFLASYTENEDRK
jgi:hypothetical protein